MTLNLSHRQPVTSLGADVARGDDPPRSYRDTRPAGSTAMPAGSLYETFTNRGRILARRSRWAFGEAAVCATIAILAPSLGGIAVGFGDTWLGVVSLVPCVAFGRVALDAFYRYEKAESEIVALAPRYLDQVEIEIHEALRITLLACRIAEGAGLSSLLPGMGEAT